MNFFCPEPCTACAPVPGSEGIFPNPNAEANPFSNFSSEKPDLIIFLPSGPTGGGGDPPLTKFNKPGCISLCVSVVSQEAADICAFNQAVLCQDANCLTCPPFDLCQMFPNAPGCVPADVCLVHPDALGCQPPTQLYYNDAQQCTVTCPDGTPFTVVVPANTFLQPTKVGANNLAYSYACNKANTDRVCLSDLNQSVCCTNQSYLGTAVVTSGSTTSPFSFSVTSGSLPPGLTLGQGSPISFFIGGIPTVSGTYVFSITATNATATTLTRQYTVMVMGIANSSLPNGTVAVPYSATMLTVGPVGNDPIWSVAGGVLPTGLSLNPITGEITGTPTAAQTVTFAIGMRALSVTCIRSYTVQIAAVNVLFGGLIWDAPVFVPTDPGSSASGTWVGNTFHPDAFCPPGGVATASCTAIGTPLVYTGPLVNCNLHITVINQEEEGGVGNNGSIQILQDGIPVLDINIGDDFVYPPGDYDFPFVVAAGVNSQITVTSAVAQCFGGAVENQSLNYIGTLTPA